MKYENWENKHYKVIDGKKSCMCCIGEPWATLIKKRLFGNSKRKHWETYHKN